MSAFDKLDEIKYQAGRYVGPVLSIVLGLVLFMKTAQVTIVEQFNPNGDPIQHEVIQGMEFRIASLFFLFVGVIWLLYILNVLKSTLGLVVSLVSLSSAVFLLYTDYSIIKKDVDFDNKKSMIFKEIKGRINDVKIAQNEYKNENGYYTSNMDSLIDYVKNGNTIKFVRKGVLPSRTLTRQEADFIYGKRANKALDNNMTDVEAKTLLKMSPVPTDVNGIIRDTVYVPVIESVYNEASYLEQRKKKDLIFDFHPDSLRYIPFSGEKVMLDTASVSRGDLKISTVLIKMPHSIDTAFIHSIGDLNDNSLKDNWSLK